MRSEDVPLNWPLYLRNLLLGDVAQLAAVYMARHMAVPVARHPLLPLKAEVQNQQNQIFNCLQTLLSLELQRQIDGLFF